MSTLLEIKTQAASYLGVAVADLTVNGEDLFLAAANQVVKTAELNHDFEFNRKLVTVTVDGATGGDLGTAVDANAAAVSVKTVIEAGLLDDNNNLVPVEWTTVAESIERQRQDTRYDFRRIYRTDDEVESYPSGRARFTFSGSSIARWPRTDESEIEDYGLWLEVYAFSSPWTSTSLDAAGMTVTGTLVPDATGTYTLLGLDANGKNIYALIDTTAYLLFYQTTAWILRKANDSSNWAFTTVSTSPVGSYSAAGTYTGTATVAAATATSDIWTTHGAQYLLWATIVQLNHKWKRFVARTEGNLPPPQALADQGLQALIDWDSNKFEQFRRHNR